MEGLDLYLETDDGGVERSWRRRVRRLMWRWRWRWSRWRRWWSRRNVENEKEVGGKAVSVKL